MTSPYDIDQALGFWLHLAFNRLRVESLHMFERTGHGITPEQWAVLVRLWQRDGRTQTEVAEATFRDKASVTRMIDALEVSGWVERRLDPDDRRVRRIHLTVSGRGLQGELVPAVEAWVQHCFDGLTPEELATTQRVLRRIYDNLDPERDPSG